MTTYFITVCAHMGQNLFQRQEVAELMVATLFEYRDTGEFELHEYVVMPNHIHLLLSLNDQQKLSRAIQLIKGGFSHRLHESGIVMRQVWQPRYHDRRVRDENEFADIAEYIRQNPVRRGLVECANQYSYSSAGNRPGLKSPANQKDDVDANLKVRSTEPSGVQEATVKGGSTGSSGCDARPKAFSTDLSGAIELLAESYKNA